MSKFNETDFIFLREFRPRKRASRSGIDSSLVRWHVVTFTAKHRFERRKTQQNRRDKAVDDLLDSADAYGAFIKFLQPVVK